MVQVFAQSLRVTQNLILWDCSHSGAARQDEHHPREETLNVLFGSWNAERLFFRHYPYSYEGLQPFRSLARVRIPKEEVATSATSPLLV